MTSARSYLDWNATAPLLPEVRAAMTSALDLIGNPSSVHADGRAARKAVETGREQVAALVGARPDDVIFTSGGTEANNVVLAAGWSRIHVADIEHDSVLGPARASGSALSEVPIARDGTVDLEGFAAPLPAAAADGGLVSLQLANNETGIIQPVAAVANYARGLGLAVHTDAVQAAGRIAVDMAALEVDYLTLSAHKLGGPKGVGAVVIRGGARVRPLLNGGGQERRRRAGTENVPGIVGFGVAAAAAKTHLSTVRAIDGRPAARDVGALRDRLEMAVAGITPDVVVVGQGSRRLPNTTCLALPGASAETLVIALDLAGVSVSAGAACSSGKVGASHVLAAMGVGADLARSAIRISMGVGTTDQHIDHFLNAWLRITGSGGVRRAVA